ncbi:MAG: Zn-ribbon containing protein [archaeon]
MPHQCVKCGTIFEDGSQELLTGCKCGGRFFFFVKKQDIEKAKEVTINLSDQEKEQIEQDVFDLIGEENADKPIVLDFESIRIIKPGKYEIDLVDLFKEKPLIFKLAEGKYMIDIDSTFKSVRKK